MPHDLNGEEIKAGDIVTVECKVIYVYPGEGSCNLTLHTVEPLFPTSMTTTITLNTKQVKKITQ